MFLLQRQALWQLVSSSGSFKMQEREEFVFEDTNLSILWQSWCPCDNRALTRHITAQELACFWTAPPVVLTVTSPAPKFYSHRKYWKILCDGIRSLPETELCGGCLAHVTCSLLLQALFWIGSKLKGSYWVLWWELFVNHFNYFFPSWKLWKPTRALCGVFAMRHGHICERFLPWTRVLPSRCQEQAQLARAGAGKATRTFVYLLVCFWVWVGSPHPRLRQKTSPISPEWFTV